MVSTPLLTFSTPPSHPQDQIKAIHEQHLSILGTEFESAKEYKPSKKDWLASHWQGFYSPAPLSRIRNTGRAAECPAGGGGGLGK